MGDWTLRILTSHEDFEAVEALQRVVWPGSETDIVPAHMLIAAAKNGGLVIGAFGSQEKESSRELIGFVFGFPGLYSTPDGPRPKHCSHMLGVHPQLRDSGLGFALKRAQWQMVRHQGLDRITWTYDPLQSRNAHLNIAKLGAVCATYEREVYGEMRDGLNTGLPSDRFQVDWWINTRRVERRLSKGSRPTLKLSHVARSGLGPLYPLQTSADDFPRPPEHVPHFEDRLLLTEIPGDFLALKAKDFSLARDWRFFTRELFETAFAASYIITDFVFDRGEGSPRGLYLLTHGESTLDQFE